MSTIASSLVLTLRGLQVLCQHVGAEHIHEEIHALAFFEEPLAQLDEGLLNQLRVAYIDKVQS